METVVVVVEIPKGSRNKYEYDQASQTFRLDRVLSSSVHYPADYGFIDGTLGGDGDALDALVVIDEPTFTGCRIECRPIGIFVMQDEKGEDEKVLCVAVADPRHSHVAELEQVSPHLLREVEHFFQVYKDLEGKRTTTFGWRSRHDAEAVISAARTAYGT
jgi:inorganic pyrophosphatase